jgi:hypothetical protein
MSPHVPWDDDMALASGGESTTAPPTPFHRFKVLDVDASPPLKDKDEQVLYSTGAYKSALGLDLGIGPDSNAGDYDYNQHHWGSDMETPVSVSVSSLAYVTDDDDLPEEEERGRSMIPREHMPPESIRAESAPPPAGRYRRSVEEADDGLISARALRYFEVTRVSRALVSL